MLTAFSNARVKLVDKVRWVQVVSVAPPIRADLIDRRGNDNLIPDSVGLFEDLEGHA